MSTSFNDFMNGLGGNSGANNSTNTNKSATNNGGAATPPQSSATPPRDSNVTSFCICCTQAYTPTTSGYVQYEPFAGQYVGILEYQVDKMNGKPKPEFTNGRQVYELNIGAGKRIKLFVDSRIKLTLGNRYVVHGFVDVPGRGYRRNCFIEAIS